MTTVERTLFINVPWEQVDAVALDPLRLPEWFAGVEQAEPDGVYPQPGGSVKLTYQVAGVKFAVTMTTLELVPGQYVTYRLEGMIKGISTWSHRPEGGGTWLTASFDYEVPGGGVGQVLDKLLIERMNADNLEKSLANLKALVEG